MWAPVSQEQNSTPRTAKRPVKLFTGLCGAFRAGGGSRVGARCPSKLPQHLQKGPSGGLGGNRRRRNGGSPCARIFRGVRDQAGTSLRGDDVSRDADIHLAPVEILRAFQHRQAIGPCLDVAKWKITKCQHLVSSSLGLFAETDRAGPSVWIAGHPPGRCPAENTSHYRAPQARHSSRGPEGSWRPSSTAPELLLVAGRQPLAQEMLDLGINLQTGLRFRPNCALSVSACPARPHPHRRPSRTRGQRPPGRPRAHGAILSGPHRCLLRRDRAANRTGRRKGPKTLSLNSDCFSRETRLTGARGS